MGRLQCAWVADAADAGGAAQRPGAQLKIAGVQGVGVDDVLECRLRRGRRWCIAIYTPLHFSGVALRREPCEQATPPEGDEQHLGRVARNLPAG